MTDTNEEEIIEPETDEVTFDEDAELDTGSLVKKLREKLKVAIEEKQKYLDSWQRDKAEFINARKRDEESKAEFLKFSKMGVIEDILPVLDSFDMAIAHGANESKEWKDGFEGIYNQLLNILSKHQVVPFGSVGDAFDPNLHHSIGTVKTEKQEEDHTVSDVAQKGYMMAEKVIRPALVRVFEV